jgi:peptide chain release factor 1
MLSATLQAKILKLYERYEEIEVLLGLSETLNDTKKLEKLSKEYAELQPLVLLHREVLTCLAGIEESKILLTDPEFQEVARLELQELEEKLEGLYQSIKLALIPTDPLDDKNIYLEVRAGTGGQEACLFAAVLLRMYLRYAEKKGWSYQIVSASESDLGGYKEVVVKINGANVYSQLKFESGGHRVQRVPVTEAQGRIHTSACTVAILPEMDEIADFDINPADLKVDTYRASGAGGQHVNKTDSAIRITHIPTGVVVECQEDRSQHKNRSKAMSLLKSKLLSSQRQKQQQERSSLRQELVGSGDRSERIRTYNYPQGRLTEHRINLTLYKLEDILEGDLDDLVQPLAQEYQASLLSDLENSSS